MINGKKDVPEHLVVGHLNRAHGLKGEIFVSPLTDHPEITFAPGVVLLMGDTKGEAPSDCLHPYLIETSRAHRQGFLVLFEGVSDRNNAEAICGRYVLRAGNEVRELDEEEIFRHNLVGMEVVTLDGEFIGEIIEVYELRSADLLEIKNPQKNILIPYVSEIINSLSLDENRIVIDPPEGLLDI
jgi:16S rRNA processing protein RimM